MGSVLKNLTQSSNYKYINWLQCFCVCKAGPMSKSCNSFGTFEHDCKRAQLSLCHFQIGWSFTCHYFKFMVELIFTPLLPCHPVIRPCFPPFTYQVNEFLPSASGSECSTHLWENLLSNTLLTTLVKIFLCQNFVEKFYYKILARILLRHMTCDGLTSWLEDMDTVGRDVS